MKEAQVKSHLGAEQVFDVPHVSEGAVDHEAIGHATRLRALAPIGRAAAPGLRGEALAAAVAQQTQSSSHTPAMKSILNIIESVLPAT